MTQFGMFIFMSILGAYLAWYKFRHNKGGFNPFKKYSKRQLKMFRRAEELQDEENKV